MSQNGTGAPSIVEESIEVGVPVSTAYNQWTQFEEFPRFMEGVESVKQLDDKRLHWVAQIGGRKNEWDAEITQQQPDQVIAWRATGGKQNAGEVRFESEGADRTRIDVHLTYEASGLVETLGGAVGADRRRVRGDLERFKELLEERGQESGAWRGEIAGGKVEQ
ncbi:MAG: SRPBCC family protein [Actinobacteria bacterium]|nr:SRPBCC family protein [Actinomycetota bacterium]